ncbi:MAG: 50S ribosomal protein L25, partial [Actinomycetota bacterium]
MTETILNADAGRETGSAASRRLRRADRIPAVIYGKGMDPLSVSVARPELRVAVSGSAGMNTILDLTVDGEVYPSLIKDVQRHPVRQNITHVDFIQVDLNAEITVSVPVRLEGEAKDVANNNGLVDLAMTEIEVTTTPRNIPDELVVDVTEMTMETTITLGEVNVPSGVTVTADPELPVVTVLTMATPVLDAEEAEREAAAAEADGAEGGGDDAGEAAGGDDAAFDNHAAAFDWA